MTLRLPQISTSYSLYKPCQPVLRWHGENDKEERKTQEKRRIKELDSRLEQSRMEIA